MSNANNNKLARLAHLTSGLGRLAGIAADALSEIADAKADKPLRSAVSFPASGWSDSGAADYPKYYDFAVSGVTAADRADVIIAPGSLGAAADCGFCPVTETLSGAVRVRAASVPATAISAEYFIQKG